MYFTTFLASILATTALAAPLEQRDATPGKFGMISTHSGNPNVHLRGIEASGQRFWLGRPTVTYCPSNIDCSSFASNITSVVAIPNTASGLSMNDVVPGGQQAYVATDGQLGYTIAHSASSPAGSLRTPFLYTPQAQTGSVGNLQFNAGGFAACPDATAGVYQIYASAVPGFVRKDCIGINIATITYTGASAWQYS